MKMKTNPRICTYLTDVFDSSRCQVFEHNFESFLRSYINYYRANTFTVLTTTIAMIPYEGIDIEHSENRIDRHVVYNNDNFNLTNFPP